MGLILDTNILISSERRELPISVLSDQLRSVFGDVQIALSAISVVELTHGIYRASTEQQRLRRRAYAEEVFRALPIHAVSTSIALLAGRIEGEAAAAGRMIPFQDLVIGATALHLTSAVLTGNVRHFSLISGLTVETLPPERTH